MAEDPIPLDRLYTAIEEHIARTLPALAFVRAMSDRLDHIAIPAVVIEMVEWEPGLDPGTGEVGVEARFEARVIVAGEEEHSLRIAAFSAAQLTVLLRMQTWGIEVEPAKFVRAAQDWTRPELDGYAVWVVEWTQIIYLGEEEWPWPNQPPGSIVWGFVPDTGPGSEGSYLPPEAME
ncbi:hypothetical protein [Pseudomonas chlororaphis]|uniref:hypothetical protein n=1 Tax=Pseudomonas chlororaphis TaxID=587753 RepID=UPI000F56FA9A|nr:hypothetical protein [Pseudomonas chlororaphis]AZE04191.1 hypothetical protein C4K11_2019 [Pseudomonas chlororaphis subsp. aureofaciens]